MPTCSDAIIRLFIVVSLFVSGGASGKEPGHFEVRNRQARPDHPESRTPVLNDLTDLIAPIARGA